MVSIVYSFNPCFNGSMYKNLLELGKFEPIEESFNPCFNGSMYKNFSDTTSTTASFKFQSLF